MLIEAEQTKLATAMKKTKTKAKKIALTTETIATLTHGQLAEVAGAGLTESRVCTKRFGGGSADHGC